MKLRILTDCRRRMLGVLAAAPQRGTEHGELQDLMHHRALSRLRFADRAAP